MNENDMQNRNSAPETENQPPQDTIQENNDIQQNEINQQDYNNQACGNNYQQGYNNQPYGNYQQGYNNQPYGNYQQGYNNQPYGNYQQGYNNQPYGNYQQGYNNQPYGNYQQDYNNQPYDNYQQGYNNQPYANYQQGYNNQPYGNYQQGYNNQTYGNYQQDYNNQPYGYYGQPAYQNQQPAWQKPVAVHGQVKNIFYYILMALTPLRYLVTFMIARTMYTSIDFASYITNGLSYSSLMAELYDVPIPSTLSTLNLLFSAAILIVSVLDIIQVSKQKYPVIGLILFTIFLKPGYFICRAFALKEPKRNAIAYTVFLAALYMGYFSWCLYYAITIAAGSM